MRTHHPPHYLPDERFLAQAIKTLHMALIAHDPPLTFTDLNPNQMARLLRHGYFCAPYDVFSVAKTISDLLKEEKQKDGGADATA